MPLADNNLSETDIRPAKGEAWIVRASREDHRPWLRSAGVCPLLAHYHIRHAAVAHMPSPFKIVRPTLGGSYFLACFGGEGQVLVDGRWFRCRAGTAVLLPPGTLQAFHTPRGKQWDFAWVRYAEQLGQRPLSSAGTPVIARYDAVPLRLAILGLYRECSTAASPAAMESWTRLIHDYVRRFAEPAEIDARLWKLWNSVADTLAAPWTIRAMCRETHLGEKQLQRLCKQQLGRTPRQQLIWLRMRRAADLLVAGNAKIETIAALVGYQNPFVFSTTFKRVMGSSPSDYPNRR